MEQTRVEMALWDLGMCGLPRMCEHAEPKRDEQQNGLHEEHRQDRHRDPVADSENRVPFGAHIESLLRNERDK